MIQEMEELEEKIRESVKQARLPLGAILGVLETIKIDIYLGTTEYHREDSE